MAHSKLSYDSFMPEYERIRNENFLKSKEQRERLYREIPRLAEIAQEMSTGAVSYARAKLSDGEAPDGSLEEYLETLQKEQDDLLTRHGYAKDIFLPIYTCKDCKDTGFIKGEPCRCLEQRMINVYYKQSLITRSLEVENFENFDLAYYPDKEMPGYSKTPYAHMQDLLARAKEYVRDFKQKGGNLLFLGSAGLGKTYMSNCIAKELLEQGITVLYLQSTRLFDMIFPDVMMNKRIDPESSSIYEYLYDCDLLILDDFGTEHITGFSLPNIYQCINERLIAGKSTILSTNLNTNELRQTYKERIFSRFVENYDFWEFYGDNIRYQKRFRTDTGKDFDK